jgi:outer membrane murein-binding lipoprotein Lpp
MRKAIAAAVAVALFMTAGCQDQQARDQNAKLQAELDAMKNQKSGGNDDLLKLLIANQQGGDSGNFDKKLYSYNEDVIAGQDKLEKLIKESNSDADKRMEDIEGRLKRVSDLETTINTLKGMIETLESKVKSVDPNQVLDAQKELINKEADLRIEKQAKDAALAEVASLKIKLEAAEAEVERLNGEVAGLVAGDISKNPQYKDIKAENIRLQSEISRWKSDYEALAQKYKALEDHLQKGSNPPPEDTKPATTDYDFSGSVVEVSRGRADGPSYLLVGSIKLGGTLPPVGTELFVLDAKEKPVCKVKVVRYYYVDDNEDLPVEEVGCSTIDEKTTRPVAKGDSVVWLTDKTEDGSEKSDSEKGKAGGD